MNKKETHVNFEVSVKPEDGGRSIFEDDLFLSESNLEKFLMNPDKGVETAHKLEKNGVKVNHIGDFSISASCTADKFETFFNTKIHENKLPQEAIAPDDYVMNAPAKGDPWGLPKVDNLDKLIDRAYIQHPPIYFNGERPIPPIFNGESEKFRLRVPTDVEQLLGASHVHRTGITGKGVRVMMPDTGFYHHPYFKEQNYNFIAVTTPDAYDHTTDPHGHGTGESANLLAVAPGINFVGIKMNFGNTVLAIKTAIDLRADIITCSWGYDLDGRVPKMPNNLKFLYLYIMYAVSKGITVFCSAGNGHLAFPASMPQVISVGGVVVDEKLNYSATDYASGFKSTWFPGRNVPDVCGLCGTQPSADYIVLPVNKDALLNKEDGWGTFSGTSASSPMVAGIGALLKESDPTLKPKDIKHLLTCSARDIEEGKCYQGHPATPGPDLATGFGLADALRAMEVVC
jgi:subtilase family serine protease